MQAYDPNQPRDDQGRWSPSGEGGGGLSWSAPMRGEENLSSAHRAVAVAGREAIGKVHDFPGESDIPEAVTQPGLFDMAYAPNSNQIFFNGGSPAIFAHEAGHALDYALGADRVPFTSKPESAPLMQAIKSSGVVDTIQKSKDRRGSYLLKDKELFARAYAQYIATKSGDTKMQKELSRDRKKGIQWDDKAFEPIAREFDSVLKNRGLLK